MTDSIYDIEVKSINGESYQLERYRGKALLIVNTASQCGFTPQYAGLEKLQQNYEGRGFAVLGFPCNQFGQQEPGDNAGIVSFCERNFGVTFPMHAKMDVNGGAAHPLFKLLKNNAKGLLGTAAIKWNFTKFLVNSDGASITRYAPNTAPADIAKDIEALLTD